MRKFISAIVTTLFLGFILCTFSCSDTEDSESKEKCQVHLSNILQGEYPELHYSDIEEGTVFTEKLLPDLPSTDNAKFLGWFALSSETENTYINVRDKSTKDIKKYSDAFDGSYVSIEAKWEVKITLNANGGKINANDIVADYKFIDFVGEKLELPKPDKVGLNRDGYTFICWSHDKEGLGSSYGTEKITTTSLPEPGEILYAIWEKGTNVKVVDVSSSETDFENTLKTLKNDDTLFVIGNSSFRIGEKEEKGKLLRNYLNNSDNKIILNLSYLERYTYSSTFENCVSISSVILGRNFVSTKYPYENTYSAYFKNCKNLKSLIIRRADEYSANYSSSVVEGGILSTLKDSHVKIYSDNYSDFSFTIGKCINAISKDCFKFSKWYNQNSSLTSDSYYAEKIIFEDTKNWYVSSKETLSEAINSNDLTPIDVSDSYKNAENFTKVYRQQTYYPVAADASTIEGDWYGKYLYKIQR